METTSPAICGGPPLFVHNLAKETEHNSIHGKILRATIETGGNTVYYNIIETGGNTVYYNINVKSSTLSHIAPINYVFILYLV
jgi:hypothetical protein